MGSQRAGMVFGALSEGLGLFIDKKWQEEQEMARRNWELQMDSIRANREAAQSDEDFYRRLAISTRDNALATQRDEADRTFRAEQGALDRSSRERTEQSRLSARQQEFFYQQVENRKAALQEMLQNYAEQEQDALANVFDEEGRKDVLQRFGELRDQAVVGFVQSMVGEAARNPEMPAYAEYKIRDRNGLKSVLLSSGLDPDGADMYAEDMWTSMSGQTDMRPEASTGRPVRPMEEWQAKYNRMLASGEITESGQPPPQSQPQRPQSPPIDSSDALFVEGAPTVTPPPAPHIPSGSGPRWNRAAAGGAGNTYQPLPQQPVQGPMDVGSAAQNLFESSGLRRWSREKFMPWYMGEQ